MNTPDVSPILDSDQIHFMMAPRLSEDDAIDLGERLDRFATGLPPSQREFLQTILVLAEATQLAAAGYLAGARSRTFVDALLAIHRTCVAGDDPISLNPQPMRLASSLSADSD